MKISPPSDGVWMSRKEAAELLGTTRSTVANLEKRGLLVGCKPFTFCRVSVASVNAYLDRIKQIEDEALAKAK